MAIRIQFDTNHNAIPPTFVLCTKSGRKLGVINCRSIVLKDALNAAAEISFTVDKYTDGGLETPLWNEVLDFRVIYCVEWDMFFEISVDVNEQESTTKEVLGYSLGESELSQVNLYGLEFNTEDDIAREDYVIAKIFDEQNDEASMLTLMLEKMPHYTINHVDSSIASIQRTFTFDEISIYDAFMDIAEEVNCLFEFNVSFTNNGIEREINVYDLENICTTCHKRNESSDTCEYCGGTTLTRGYGEDANVFISKDNLADDINYSTDVDSVKNCFKLVAGDDLMTATIINQNPNGSGYLWYFSDEVKRDMSTALVNKLDAYDTLYAEYKNTHAYSVTPSEYNTLISKYQTYNPSLTTMASSITGYSALMEAYYNAMDFSVFLNTELMPSNEVEDRDATSEGLKLNTPNLSPVSVQNLDTASQYTVNSAVLSMAKTLIYPTFSVNISEATYTDNRWRGKFIVENYSDEDDTYTTSTVTVVINGNYENFVKQKIDKLLNSKQPSDSGIIELFNMSLDSFKSELKKYGYTSLGIFRQCCDGCLDIMHGEGISNENHSEYTSLYLPYYNKSLAIDRELGVRENELAIIGIDADFTEGSGNSVGEQIESHINATRTALDFQDYLGTTLWQEFITYRREDTYSNSNFISDGLDNAEIFANAREFMEYAERDIYKSATLQHTITATLKNLLVMKEFESLLDKFEVGNWIRIKSNEDVYKLRLLDYQVDFENLSNLSVTFSDVKKVRSGSTDVQSILRQASSMASSYPIIQRSVTIADKTDETLKGWSQKGLDLSQVQIINNAKNQEMVQTDSGILVREYLPITNTYTGKQLKIINRGVFLTNDSWKSTRAAIGNFIYLDPESEEYVESYGINGEAIVGKLLLGESLGIYNEDATLKFNNNGLVIYNDTNSVTINPNADKLLKIKSGNTEVFYTDTNGNVKFSGDLVGATGTFAGELSAATGTFAGSLSAATGTFTGSLSAATGTFAGSLSAATGTFSGDLSAAGGTFAGTLTASAFSSISVSAANITGGTITGCSLTVGGSASTGIIVNNQSGNAIAAINYSGIITYTGYYGSGSAAITISESDSDSTGLDDGDESDGSDGSESGTFDTSNYMRLIYGSSNRHVCVGNSNGTNQNVYNYLGVNCTFGVYAGSSVSPRFVSYYTSSGGKSGNRFKIYCLAKKGNPGSSAVSRTSGGVGVRVGTTGILYRYTGSSQRYKHDITTNISIENDPHKLYDISFVQFKYNKDVAPETDQRYMQDIPGLIAEDVYEHYPMGAELDEEGMPCDWNEKYLLPPMLKLIQEQKEMIDNLETRISQLENKKGI